jgi:iron-sulfur cluster assembly accessory protein
MARVNELLREVLAETLERFDDDRLIGVTITSVRCDADLAHAVVHFDVLDGPEADDEVLEVGGVRVFVDPFSAQYLAGVEIDYVSSMMGQGFTFRNPNASGGCGCGSSFTV